MYQSVAIWLKLVAGARAYLKDSNNSQVESNMTSRSTRAPESEWEEWPIQLPANFNDATWALLSNRGQEALRTFVVFASWAIVKSALATG